MVIGLVQEKRRTNRRIFEYFLSSQQNCSANGKLFNLRGQGAYRQTGQDLLFANRTPGLMLYLAVFV